MGQRLFLGALLLAITGSSAIPEAQADRVLVFTETAGFRHDSISAAVAALRGLAERHGVTVDHTEDAAAFSESNLRRYRVVVFANTTGDVLDDAEQRAFRDYIVSGGGYLGIHAAADTEYGWPWYGVLVGAYFRSHPPGLQTGTVSFAAREPGRRQWRVTDEFYNFRRTPRPRVKVIATLDERTYRGGEMGADHPIAWCQTVAGGRSWYTGLGHRPELYADPTFVGHLESGLLFAAGYSDNCYLMEGAAPPEAAGASRAPGGVPHRLHRCRGPRRRAGRALFRLGACSSAPAKRSHLISFAKAAVPTD